MNPMKFAFAVLLMISPASFAGQEGHGGDGVEYGRHRVYALDYSLYTSENPGEVRSFATAEEANQYVLANLWKKSPVLAEDFEAFLASRSTWACKDSLEDIADEKLTGELPPLPGVMTARCRRLLQPKKTQAVIRWEENGTVRFEYSAEQLRKLSKNGDQLSWILVHEWLWNFLPDASRIREVNGYLHSYAFERESVDDFVAVLMDTGLVRAAR